MEATDGSVLIHVPPAVLLLSEVVAPTHMLSVPVIGPGVVLTVAEVVYVFVQADPVPLLTVTV
jgi:hypothetical protein